MTTNDPISDMLTRIRNAMAVHKPEVIIPFSKVKLNILEILKQEGYISDVAKVSGKDVDGVNPAFNYLRITLKYVDGDSAIRSLKRISKPSRRVYIGKKELPIVLNSLGIAIISTSQGLMTNIQAKSEGVGGEIICEVY